MPWSQLTLVTDTELGALEPEATSAAAPWGSTTWANARAEGKRDLKILLEADFSEVPNVADKVVDTWRPDWVLSAIGGVFTDRTSQAADKTEDDLPLATVFATFGTDKLYVGCSSEFEGLRVLMTATVNAIASVLTAKYSSPTGFATINATDGTVSSGKTFAKSGRITWTMPSDWQRESLNGMADAYYWIELTVSAALSASTSATQILPIRPHDGLKRVAALLTLSHIFKGLSAAAAEPKDWLERAMGYRQDALDLWGKLKASSAVWLDLDRDEAIEEGAGETHVSRPLFLGRA